MFEDEELGGFFKFFAAWGCFGFVLSFLFYGGLIVLALYLLNHYQVI